MPSNFSYEYLTFDSAFLKHDDLFREQLWSWGNNSQGQLADGSVIAKSSPVQIISQNSRWKYISSNYATVAAIDKNDDIWLWGLNNIYQLADGSTSNRSSPVQLVFGTKWKRVECGNSYVIALNEYDELYGWGSNIDGQLGIWGFDEIENVTYLPINNDFASNSNLTTFDYSCGNSHTAIIATDGSLYVFGYNYWGQLGINSVETEHYPQYIEQAEYQYDWIKVSCGDNHTAAIDELKRLWTWGGCLDGQLGNNDRIDKSSPSIISVGGTNWISVVCGLYQTAAIKEDNTLWLWGRNDQGRLGDGTTVSRSVPVQTSLGGSNWAKVACNGFSTAAIKTDGSLWTWGDNEYGQLGDNTTSSRSTPGMTVMDDNAWTHVACGRFHTTALRLIE